MADGQAPGTVGPPGQARTDLDPDPFTDRDLRQLLPCGTKLAILDPDRRPNPIWTGLIAPFVMEHGARFEPQCELA